MSNFSNIGFNVTTEDEFNELIEKVIGIGKVAKVNEGAYSVYRDSSGAELWIQLNKENEYIGVNPHFKGKSRRKVCLTSTVERPESELDGAFHCWADPTEENNPDTGEYPFVFDSPDFRTIGDISFPRVFELQLSAFSQELTYFPSEKEYDESLKGEPGFAVQSFIPSGLFSLEEGNDTNPQQAFGIFTGLIKDVEKKQNQLTGEYFYSFLVDTLGGEVDVVAGTEFFENEPVRNGVVQGQFWLSGQLLNAPEREIEKGKTFFQKFLGRFRT